MEGQLDVRTALQRVIDIVSTRDSGIGDSQFAESIVAAAKDLLRKVPQDRSQPMEPALERYIWDFCRFVLQDFPAVFRLPFQILNLNPMFADGNQQFDVMYEHQDAWAAEWLFRLRPDFFVDVGSRVCFVGIVSRAIPCIAIDARPTPLRMDNLDYRVGEGQCLPFEDGSVPALTCLHAVEHFGLGRYGDTVDNTGWVKGFAEFRRVLMPGGWLFVSTPVRGVPAVQFNAQYLFTPEVIKDQFSPWGVQDEQFLWPSPVSPEEHILHMDTDPGYGTYCALFRKPKQSNL
jgi:SAM-dependent methyltransferase